jgi:DNA repair protein RadA/Sms
MRRDLGKILLARRLLFAMTEKGLKGVSNPSAIFLSQHAEPVPGSCVMVTLEGTRPMLVEIQALVDSGGPSPRRLSVGLDKDRLAMLLAVLHRHAGVACMDQDVFVNAVGGVRISEPAADLAVVPKANAPKKAIEGLTIHAVDRVEQAMDVVRGLL